MDGWGKHTGLHATVHTWKSFSPHPMTQHSSAKVAQEGPTLTRQTTACVQHMRRRQLLSGCVLAHFPTSSTSLALTHLAVSPDILLKEKLTFKRAFTLKTQMNPSLCHLTQTGLTKLPGAAQMLMRNWLKAAE